jgi:phospholipase C
VECLRLQCSAIDTSDIPRHNRVGQFTDFETAAANGTLLAYSFLEPGWGAAGNSHHPNYNIALGEQLIHRVHYALRNAPLGTRPC